MRLRAFNARHAARWAACAVLVLGTAIGCSEPAAEGGAGRRRPPVTVEIARAESTLVVDVEEFTGQLTAGASVMLRSEIHGVIESIEFDEGQTVEAGQVLFRLESDEQRARLREAEAELSLMEAVHKRTEELARRDVSSAAQLDHDAAGLEREKARVELARVELDRTVIRAPFDGAMGDLLVAVGTRLEPETDMVTIAYVDRLQLAFTVPEIAINMAQPGAPLEFGVVSYPGEIFHGEVYFVSPTLDANTRRLLVKAWVPNPDHRLRPGQFANIRAEIGRREAALVIPETAIVLDRQGSFVWRVGEGGKIERVSVRLGARMGSRVEIVEGLHDGDRVVGAGTHKVQSGSIVQGPGGGSGSGPEDARDTADVSKAQGEGS